MGFDWMMLLELIRCSVDFVKDFLGVWIVLGVGMD